ncbi:hypothetical protein KR059_005870, partial [Drosophila kikkawai]
NPTGSLNAVNPNEDLPGPANVQATNDTLLGLEDLAHGTNDDGVPFILVDGAPFTTRSGLDLALSRVEQKRMEHVLKDIESRRLQLLEDTEPPPELDMPINLSARALAELKAAEEEQRFQKDMYDLTFWPPEEENDDTCITPTMSTNCNTSIEEVILKLEQLRGSPKHIPVPETEAPTAELPQRPGIQRQGTFDIKRKDEGNKELGPDIAIIEEPTTKKPQSPKPVYQGGIPSIISHKRLEKSPENPSITVRGRQITKQIGDLLVELCTLNQQNKRLLNEGSSHSFLVTISPAGGASNCSIKPITDSKFSHLRLSWSPSSFNIISHSQRAKSELNCSISGRNSLAPYPSKQEFPEERVRSQFMQKTPSSFLKVSSPAKYYQGRKRD